MKKLSAVVLLLISTAMLLGGCWNQRELTDLALVMALGVDKGANKDKYDISLQVVVPANVATGQNGGGGQGPPVVVYKSSGNNLTEASRKATRQIPRTIYYAHTSILVIGEELAREGILDLLDALNRDPYFRTTTFVIIAKGGKAEDLVATLTNLDKLPVNRFTKTLQATQDMLGENVKVDIDDIITSLSSSGKEPLISGFKIIGDPKKGTSPQNIDTSEPPAMMQATGLAVFRGGKLVGWLDGDKAKGAVWVLNKMKGTDVDFDWKGKKDAVSLTPYKSDTKISVTTRNGKPFINITVQTACRLSEINVPFDITDPMNLAVFEKKMDEQIKKDIEVSVHTAQKYKSDIFGFGENIHRANPKLWEKIKGDWDDQFAQMGFNVKVHAYARELGIRNNPFWQDLKK